jgi:hypothetical protein
MEVTDLLCSGCGKDCDEMAALKSGDEIICLMCRQCLVDAVKLIDSLGQEVKGRDAAN